jgi:single-stranded DNA-binding protein
MDTWEKDGQKHQKLKVRASTIKFLAQGDRLNGGPQQRPQWQPSPMENAPSQDGSLESDPDDIPF